MLGVGAKKKTYLDDVFSTFLYKGNKPSTQSINNGIDLSTEGGLVWIKSRTNTYNNILQDTANGTGKFIKSNASEAATNTSQYVTSFNTNGYTLGTDNDINNSSQNFASWTFLKAKGFFDVVTYTGNGSNRTIAHSLGCVPGLIMIKNVSAGENWRVYHRTTKATHNLQLNGTDAAGASSTPFNNTEPTASVFSVGTDGATNNNGDTIVAYLFAGGASTAATARSVDFAGGDSDDYLLAPSALLPAGNDSTNFCLETWVRFDAVSGNRIFYSQYAAGDSGRTWISNSGGKLEVWQAGTTHMDSPANSIQPDIWYHVAWTYDGTTHRLFLDGLLQDTVAGSSLNAITASNPKIGGDVNYELDGQLSNFRVVHGQSVYTSSFRPSKEPLTTTSQGVTGSNCKALLFNNSSVLNNDGALAALTNPNSGAITASTDSTFDDPAGFVFGDSGKESIIKCGSHSHPTTDTVRIYTGWEPQWIMLKNASVSSNWAMIDCMRGIIVGADGPTLAADSNAAESGVVGSGQYVIPHGDGFSLKYGLTAVNPGNGNNIIYIAIRRSDGYCGKPIETGTGAFTMDTGSSSATIPTYDSGFPVDYAIARRPAATDPWYTSARLMQGKFFEAQSSGAEQTSSNFIFDSNSGWAKDHSSDYQSWMWKRHAGFDVVAYTGNSVAGRQISHSLNKTPEMIWVKQRNGTALIQVYHKGLNGGTNPGQYYIKMNTEAEEANQQRWNNTTQDSSTTFTLGTSGSTNSNNDTYIAMLFASVDGVSKVGYYTGNGSTTGPIITTGFTPRLIIIKRADDSGSWYIYDTVRGLATGTDQRIELNDTSAQYGNDDLDPTATGFQLKHDWNNLNGNGGNYIYYAHA